LAMDRAVDDVEETTFAAVRTTDGC